MKRIPQFDTFSVYFFVSDHLIDFKN